MLLNISHQSFFLLVKAGVWDITKFSLCLTHKESERLTSADVTCLCSRTCLENDVFLYVQCVHVIMNLNKVILITHNYGT